MPSSDYVALASHLPAFYQDEQDSFAQVDSYLGLVDDLQRAVLDRLEELEVWLSPFATDLWPPDLESDAGRDAVTRAYLALFDELAGWVAFRFPGSWSRDESALTKRRHFLLRAARLWRRRGTPRGFLDWFVFAFDIAPENRPYLIEHFKVAAPDMTPDPWLRATLIVPSTSQFADYARRREAIAFADRYAPAHVDMRVCWARPDFTLDPVPAPGDSIAVQDAFRARVRDLLCSLVSFTDHANGIRIWECIDEGRSIDRLGVGRLPGGGE